MTTPVVDFLNRYSESDYIRLHMPGHKGRSTDDFFRYDITEIDGADNLFDPKGIILESMKNASELFSSHTYYSCEGSSLCIRAMIYLAMLEYKRIHNEESYILAFRNVHKSFVSAIALLGIDVEWITSDVPNYLSCPISPDELEKYLKIKEKKPAAVYVTSPDYLGNILDIKGLADVCHREGTMLLVDNAHGAYLKFLKNSLHPIDLGADICCDSAHKTLDALTGTAYLHVSDNCSEFIFNSVFRALALFASTSPSYMLIRSLDALNAHLSNNYPLELQLLEDKINKIKEELSLHGYRLLGNEPLKITIDAGDYGYSGTEFYSLLMKNKIICEYYDKQYIVIMISVSNTYKETEHLLKILLSIKKEPSLVNNPPAFSLPVASIKPFDAIRSMTEEVKVSKKIIGSVAGDIIFNCPPAVPIVICGEIIDYNIYSALKYYGYKTCNIIKNPDKLD